LSSQIRLRAPAAVEGEHGGVDSDACERLVDYAARESGRLRVAHHGGKEDVKVAATLLRPRWRSEEEDEEQCGKRTLHHRSSFTIPFVPAQAGSMMCQDNHRSAASTSSSQV
jgi:hypothetical protein